MEISANRKTRRKVFPGAAKSIIVHHNIIFVYSVNAIKKPLIFSKQFIRQKAAHFTNSFFLFFLLLTVRTPRAKYYVLCLFGGVCAAASTF